VCVGVCARVRVGVLSCACVCVCKTVGVIHRIARLLPQSIKLSLYYPLVYPYLSYIAT